VDNPDLSRFVNDYIHGPVLFRDVLFCPATVYGVIPATDDIVIDITVIVKPRSTA
jgi:hypothetical protein